MQYIYVADKNCGVYLQLYDDTPIILLVDVRVLLADSGAVHGLVEQLK